MILDDSGREDLVTDDLTKLLPVLEPVAQDMGCAAELAGIADMVATGASYQRPRDVAESSGGELDAVVQSLVEEMRAGRPLLTKS